MASTRTEVQLKKMPLVRSCRVRSASVVQSLFLFSSSSIFFSFSSLILRLFLFSELLLREASWPRPLLLLCDVFFRQRVLLRPKRASVDSADESPC